MRISDLKKKIHLINSSSKSIILAGYTIAFLIILSTVSYGIDSDNSKNVTLDGYTFTLADANDWFTDLTTEAATGYRWGGSSADGYSLFATKMLSDYWHEWHGQVMKNAFYLPAKECRGQRHCFDDDDWDENGNCKGGEGCYSDPDAYVAIYVLDKIDPNQVTEGSVLKEASVLSNGYILADLIEGKVSEKNITFNELPAHLLENKGMAAMSIDLSPDKVAVIDVNYYYGSPWYDVLDKIRISKS